MIELLKFATESLPNFLATVFFLTYFYALFGTAGKDVVISFFNYKKDANQKALETKRAELEYMQARYYAPARKPGQAPPSA